MREQSVAEARAPAAPSGRRIQRGGAPDLASIRGGSAILSHVQPATIIGLQRTAGNAAITGVLQRHPLATPAKAKSTRPLLVRGSQGSQVRVLQQRLNALGTTPALKVDGDFDKSTFDAVVAFQQQHFPDDEKEWDGKVGPHTWGAIEDAYPEPEIDADQAAVGQKVVEGMDRVNAAGPTESSGVWYSYNYRNYHPDKYRPDMLNGYADPTYFERTGFMEWKLKPRMSASAAIRSWLDGLTIAECFTAMIAVEHDAMRASIGNDAFDREFGSTDRVTPAKRRMVISQTSSTVSGFMKKTEAGEKNDEGKTGDRPARPGDWYYFMNHPKYLLKHPGGAWQGENSIYIGREGGVQKWAGMGTSTGTGVDTSSHVTEAEMLDSMVGAYNENRDQDDERVLNDVRAANGGVLPPVLDPVTGAYPDKLGGPADILSAPAERLDVPGFMTDTFDRKGGFVAWAGKSLDVDALKQLRTGEASE